MVLVNAGVLLVNLGSPDEPTTEAVQRYLKTFLSDKRVIKKQGWLWRLILNQVILRKRAPISAKLYQSIWRGDGLSPLIHHTEQLANKLQLYLTDSYLVESAMRYGDPSIYSKFEKFQDASLDSLLIIPLYPHFSYTTTASVKDEIQSVLAKLPSYRPTLRIIDSYYHEHLFIDAIISSVMLFQQKNGKPDLLLCSYHGLPESSVREGDPYCQSVLETTGYIRQALITEHYDISSSFQSRFGPTKWLRPYTREVLIKAAQNGVKSVQVICPGFACDCLETLEEIMVENRDVFLKHGGECYQYIPCLNEQDSHVALMAGLVTKNH